MTAATAPAYMKSDDPISPWWLTLISGIAAIIVGIFLFSRPIAGTLLLVQILGWFWFFNGILHIVQIFMDRRQWGWNLFLGILGIVAGLYIVRQPIFGAVTVLATLVILLGVQAIIYGIASLIAAFQGGGFGSAILGIISIIMGVVILGNPLISAAVLPWVYGTLMVAGGIVAIFAAFRQRSGAMATA